MRVDTHSVSRMSANHLFSFQMEFEAHGRAPPVSWIGGTNEKDRHKEINTLTEQAPESKENEGETRGVDNEKTRVTNQVKGVWEGSSSNSSSDSDSSSNGEPNGDDMMKPKKEVEQAENGQKANSKRLRVIGSNNSNPDYVQMRKLENSQGKIVNTVSSSSSSGAPYYNRQTANNNSINGVQAYNYGFQPGYYPGYYNDDEYNNQYYNNQYYNNQYYDNK